MTTRRQITRLETTEIIPRKVQLQWLRHVRVHRMDERQIPRQALSWFPKYGKRRPGRPRKSWAIRESAEYRDTMDRL